MLEILRKIGAAQAAGALFYVSQAEGLPLLQNAGGALIAVDQSKLDPQDNSKIAAVLTEAGARMVAEAANSAPAQVQVAAQKPTIMTGFVAPKVKRVGGGQGAPTKYPFEGLEIGQFFFIANTAVEKGDAFKTLSSAVGSANQRYAEETGATKEVERAKRDSKNKAIKGADGKNVMEKVTLPVKRQLRRFIVRAVKANVEYGTFKAPADGAVVQRVELETEAS